ncbi:MAG: hypothetical protein HC828_09495 [Blastochloris sp.]|nr:hypothetical protein [Blastochloris sp.]
MGRTAVCIKGVNQDVVIIERDDSIHGIIDQQRVTLAGMGVAGRTAKQPLRAPWIAT